MRKLIPSPAFIRKAKRAARKWPGCGEAIRDTLKLLSEDAYDSRLRTHKLKGQLTGSCACSACFDLRIIFRFIEYEGSAALLLESVGSHEDVY